MTATRFLQNPLITVDSSPSLGGNVNGPTVIRVPDWVERPLGRYYMYFANHVGAFIRLAYADDITGPWRIHEPGVLHVRDTAFYRPQPDVMTQGGPSDASTLLMFEVYRNAFVYTRFGYAAAISTLLLAVIALVVALQARFLRVEYEY